MIKIDEKEIEQVINHLRVTCPMSMVEPVVIKMREWLEQKPNLKDVSEKS
jgi:hypothetical protein